MAAKGEGVVIGVPRAGLRVGVMCMCVARYRGLWQQLVKNIVYCPKKKKLCQQCSSKKLMINSALLLTLLPAFIQIQLTGKFLL